MQSVLIDNNGTGTLNWTVTTRHSWIFANPLMGSGSGKLEVSIDVTGLGEGDYSGAIEISDPNATNSPLSITVNLKIYPYGNTSLPFGSFDTPVDGSTNSGSVNVTGWVLDDVGVTDVKIYNDSGSGIEYIGDASFIQGARPDVEAAYPDYPNNYQAGWGYMMLTNLLPDGTTTLYAKTHDLEGNTVPLGSKSIAIDNANAVKPFGAIDTPEQGGVASGPEYPVWGWVLTPQPNTIPTNGSTINVYIDGVDKGHPEYDFYRADIAAMFPGYNNSNGSGCSYLLNTTEYSNGVHTIQWTATDDAGNSDGIGSRYFTIYNGATPLAVEDASLSLSEGFTVLPAYPNPFNPSTTITYRLDNDSDISIQIYDITGQLISTLQDNYQTQGWHSVVWNGTNQYDKQVPAGIYISKIKSGDEAKTTKLMLLK